MTIELVVFDVAGTTVVDDDAVADALLTTVADAGLRATRAQAARVMGLPKPVALRALLGAGASPDRIAMAHRAFVERMIHHYLSSPRVRPVPGTETAFDILRAAGVRIGLDTGFDRRILDAILHRLGWLDGVFDVTVASDEVPRGRPHADMIVAAMEKLGLWSASEVAKVGDTEADMREAVAAGCGLAIGVLTGTGTALDLVGAGATVVVDGVADVPGVILGRPTRAAS